MDYTKSKFTANVFFLGFFALFITIGIIAVLIKSLIAMEKFEHIFFVLLFVGLFFLTTNFLKGRKYLIVKENVLKSYSIFRPFGQTFYLSNYLGKLSEIETGSAGSYKVIYLIDQNNKTSFKIMGLHYKDFETLNNAIALKEIKYSLSGKERLKLLFTGNLTLKNKNSSSDAGNFDFIGKLAGKVVVVAIILIILRIILKWIG